MTTCKTCGKETDMPFHTCMTTPTPQTDAQYKEYARRDNNVKCVDIDFARQLEQELNEVKEYAAGQRVLASAINDAATEMVKERDQLRKVVDELAESGNGIKHNIRHGYDNCKYSDHQCNCGIIPLKQRFDSALELYNQLPHVIERKTK